MKRILLAIVIMILIFFVGCHKPGIESTNGNGGNAGSETYYTLADLQQARDEGNCWTAIHGKVYDISDFVVQHPGGDIISEACGIDATTLFETRPGEGTPHSQSARQLLEDYYIGEFR